MTFVAARTAKPDPPKGRFGGYASAVLLCTASRAACSSSSRSLQPSSFASSSAACSAGSCARSSRSARAQFSSGVPESSLSEISYARSRISLCDAHHCPCVSSCRRSDEDTPEQEAHRLAQPGRCGTCTSWEPCYARSSRSAASSPGTTRKNAQLPRCSRSTSPASSSTLRWWLTVGWPSPSGSVRWQTQASPSGWDWRRLMMRRRAGSARALSEAASAVASVGSSAPARSGGHEAEIDGTVFTT